VKKITVHYALALAMPLLLAGCGEGTGVNGGAQISLSFSAGAGVAGSNFQAAPGLSMSQVASDPITDGTNVLDLTNVELVFREVELERVEVADCDDIEPEPVGCEEFEIGPMVVALPLDGSPLETSVVDIDPGMYDEIEFDIHKLSDDPEDAALLALRPDFDDASIRVDGTYNGVPFTFFSDISEELEFDLVPALVIDDVTTSTNITIQFEVAAWFRTLGGSLVDPASANKGGANESLVKDNIKNAIEAFEDEDHDGEDDHDNS